MVPSAYPEQMDNASDPGELVVQNSLGKARDVQAREPGLILGADTIVVLDGTIYGKPRDTGEAVHMLTKLQGRWHTVHTGQALVDAHRECARHRSTRVRLRTMSTDQIRAYVSSGEPLDKAGAYAIQGLGAALVEAIDGCYTTVVGLSLPMLVDMLFEFEQFVF